MVQAVMMMNRHVWNEESVKKSDQDLVDEMSLEVYTRDWVMNTKKSGLWFQGRRMQEARVMTDEEHVLQEGWIEMR